jgi:hypothetical protein
VFVSEQTFRRQCGESSQALSRRATVFKEKFAMNAKVVLLCAALAAGMLAGCDRMKTPADNSQVAVPQVSSLPPLASPSKESAPKAAQAPIQGQVDPKEPAQRRDFETSKR